MATLSSVDSLLMVADISRTLNAFRPLGETLERICERVAGLGGYQATALFMPDPQQRQLVIRGSWGLETAYVDYINREHPILLDDTRQLGLAPTAEACLSGHHVVLPDTETEPSFEPWKPGARLQGYRSLACIPVILRSQVIGVLVCYGRDPHRHTGRELEALQLVARLAGVAIETARVAEGQRRAVDELRELSSRLQCQNEELRRLNAMQSQLAEDLADPDARTLERTVRTLAELTRRAVLVAAPAGQPLVYAGPPEGQTTMALVGSRELALQLRQRQMVTMEGFTCLRIGAAEMPLGVIVLRPPLEDESGTEALAASHAAAIMAAELHSERADRTLHTYARPATLLALAHGLYAQALLREPAGILGIPADARLRLALFGCATPAAANRLSRRMESIRGAGWPAIAAAADGCDALVLLEPGKAAGLRRAGRAVREAQPEVERIGVSSELAGLEALAAGLGQARTAAVLEAGQANGAILFEDLGVFGELACGLPPRRVEEWVRRVLGRLRSQDEAHNTRLVDTLAAYVRHQGRIKEVAAELGVHANTIHQRLRRIADLGGFDLRDFGNLSQVVLALEWERMLRAQGVRPAPC